jgi:hypothetical protein
MGGAIARWLARPHVLRTAYCVALRSTLTAPRTFILGGERRALMGDCYENALARSHVCTLERFTSSRFAYCVLRTASPYAHRSAHFRSWRQAPRGHR